MNTGMMFITDWWGQWSVDMAGVEIGTYNVRELRAMLDRGEIHARTWLRHAWTQRYSLVGEVLFSNKQASEAEYEEWFPLRRQPIPVSAWVLSPVSTPPVIAPPQG